MDANSTVAANIRAELSRGGLTQADLAHFMGENEMWISRRMKGAPAFSTNEVQAAADYLGVSVGDLFIAHSRPSRPGNGARRRALYLLEENEAPIISVESARLATVTSIQKAPSLTALHQPTEEAI